MNAREKRTKSITVWLTDDEYRQINERKTQARMGAWVRDTVLGVEPKKRKAVKTADPDLLLQLARMGGNLNQIAYQMNLTKPNEPYDGVRILAELATIRHQLDEILKRHDS